MRLLRRPLLQQTEVMIQWVDIVQLPRRLTLRRQIRTIVRSVATEDAVDEEYGTV